MSCQIKWMNCGVHSFAKPVCEESGGARFRKAICFIASFTFLLHLLSRFKKPCLPTSPAHGFLKAILLGPSAKSHRAFACPPTLRIWNNNI